MLMPHCLAAKWGHENIRDEIAEEMRRYCNPKISLIEITAVRTAPVSIAMIIPA
jgi:hypothetical protein